MESSRLNMVVLGGTGNGKSWTGNTLAAGKGDSSLKHQKNSGGGGITSIFNKLDFDYDGKQLRYIDSPGTGDTDHSPKGAVDSLY